MRPHRARGGFTLLELLVVVGIIALLAGFLYPTLAKTIQNTKIARARSDMKALVLAVNSYHSDTGRYPRRPGPIDDTTIWRNDIAWLYAALRNEGSPALGGGNGSRAPYDCGEWAPKNLGYVAPDVEDGDDPTTGKLPPWVLGELESDLSPADVEFQRAHLPGTARALAFLDPWGNPYWYREWSSVPDVLKANGQRRRTVRSDVGEATTAIDCPRMTTGVQIWSCGPDGWNQWGGGDDITSWSQ
jgi:prepilin-type N-terminal cleavage/methylation domain-containing protein